MENGDSVASLASELAQRTRSSKLYGGDIIQTIQLLQNLVNKMGANVGDASEDRRHELVKDLIQVRILFLYKILSFLGEFSSNYFS